MQVDLTKYPHITRFRDEATMKRFRSLDLKVAEELEKHDDIFPNRVGVRRTRQPDGTMLTDFNVLGSMFRIVNNGIEAYWLKLN